MRTAIDPGRTAPGLYDPRSARGSCGVGFLVRLGGRPSHSLVEDGLKILKNLEHRGATGGDGDTGDGAGIMVQLPDEFFRRQAADLEIDLPPSGDYAAGMFFLPGRSETADRIRALAVGCLERAGLRVLGWREVPLRPDCLGEQARLGLPRVAQLLVGRGVVGRDGFENALYLARREMEREAPAEGAEDFHVASLSPRTIVYKGLLTATQLPRFFPDLAEESFRSSWAVVHQRYSTNTLPLWRLAQPFRLLAHNGEINTLRGNINRMKTREPLLASPLFGDGISRLLPVLDESGSDSAVFDNMLEFLVRAGRSLPHAVMMLVPEAWGGRYHLSEDKRAFYEYHSALMEPWDGPAAVAFCDGRFLGATLDRNGLRPARYTVTRDGLVVMASEAGALPLPAESILERGRLQPGKMLIVDLLEGRLVPDREIKARVSRRRPYRKWVRENRIELAALPSPAAGPDVDPASLPEREAAFGFTDEELRMVLAPMAARGQEPVGSMGNDSVLPVLSPRPQLLFSYFRQLFAQVTNPPIDPLREELVMSLMGWLGRERNLLEETPGHCRRLKLPHPILTPGELERIRQARTPEITAAAIETTFPAGGGGKELESALDSIFAAAEREIGGGATVIVLSDRSAGPDRVPIPSLLALSGLHHHLIRKGLRSACSLVVDTGEAREVMHIALLIGYGASAVCPYLALAIVERLALGGRLEEPVRPEEAVENYVTALKKGLLKTFSRMGISTIRSFAGAQIFEALGVGEEVVERYFTGTVSRISGVGLEEIAEEANRRHQRAYPAPEDTRPLLEPGGAFHFRRGGERHLWSPEAIARLRHAVRSGDYSAYLAFSEEVDRLSAGAGTLRGLLAVTPAAPVPLEEVEPEEEILRRFVSGAMSFGSLGKEAHEAIGLAMNRLGGRSNCGEGGEADDRAAGAESRIRQVASGRFGVTASYLRRAREIQIKIAQGAKPGEGGQLPGRKVTAEIARVRRTVAGVTLISPPPHHDIYSIEDLAQLIYDLKAVNPGAAVSVKLVSEAGVGTIAAGVAKAGADLVVISGGDGGTGAAPLTAIKHVGLPWELGLAETHQALAAGRLRGRVRLQADGQLRTARDVVVAALLGAEEFGFGTAVLVSLGCVMARKCHLGLCPAGICSQDPAVRALFTGRPEHLENFFRFLARHLRETMAALGFRSVAEMTGRSDRLSWSPPEGDPKARKVDLSRLLAPAPGGFRPGGRREPRPAGKMLDDRILADLGEALERGERVALSYPVTNVDRALGARLSGEIVHRRGPAGLPEDTVTISFSGSAGQSFGAFLAPGLTLRLAGEANDYLGKGMSGGRIVVVPPPGADLVPHDNVIAGNTVLYGATGGEVFLQGTAGERFAVRNSGATAVVEGVGDHGCEYMTGGTVVVLGPTGNNFAAGMSGGTAYVYDETELFDTRCNLDMVNLESVFSAEDAGRLKGLIERHLALTGSGRARWLLANWESRLPLFVRVMPIEYGKALERMRLREDLGGDTVSATEEVFK